VLAVRGAPTPAVHHSRRTPARPKLRSHDVPEAAQAGVAELRPRGGAVGYGERRRGRWRHREEKGGWEGQCEREWGGKLGFHCYLYEMKIYIGPVKIGLHLGPTLWVEVTTHALSTYRDGPALNTIDRA
jgi:hypothetical protein